ncbi:type II secretion system protein [Candidatus Neomarinimicrobiota bacterium]
MENRRIKKLFSDTINSKGYTLIELIVTMTIIGIIASLLAMYLMVGTGVFNKVQSRKSLVINASLSLKKFTREVSSTWHIISATSKNIQFTATMDTLLILSYEINTDGTLTRKLGNGNKELIATNIDYNSSNFSYFDINDNIGTPIRRIRISLLFISNDESSRFTADVSPETIRER